MTPNFHVIFCTYHAPITDSVTCWMREKYMVIIHDLIDSMAISIRNKYELCYVDLEHIYKYKFDLNLKYKASAVQSSEIFK